jgi:colanic acid biosynthesis protein WcaH
MWLDQKSFIEVTKNSPLVSVDLLINDGFGYFLLGKRINRPAQGSWFVPGGRVLKGNTLCQAFSSIVQLELNLSIPFDFAKLRGVYENFYEDNFFEISGFGTHYIVIAYELTLSRNFTNKLPYNQHSEWAFLSPAEIEGRTDVHPGSKVFFR